MQMDELARLYQAKSDEELLLLSRKPEELTSEAQNLLRGELAKRRIASESVVVVEEGELATVLAKVPVPKPLVEGAKSSGEFLREVTRLYRDHFWLFIKLVAPAVVISYFVRLQARGWSREVLTKYLYLFPRIPEAALFKVNLLTFAWRLISGLLFCISFAAICSAVAQVVGENGASILHCLKDIRKGAGSLVLASIGFLALIWVADELCAEFINVVYWGHWKIGLHLRSYELFAVTYVPFFLLMLLLSRLALAMPAVILDEYRMGQAFFRSDELTEGKWVELTSLLAKSVIGGYVVGMLPFWAAELLWRCVHFPVWGLDAASVLGVTMVEPFMFIGFALMYMQGRERQTS